MQNLAHTLYQLTGSKLEDFRCPLGLGEFSSWEQHLDPLCDRRILVTVTDEEKCQFRALNLIYGVLRIRGMPQSDYAHRSWNDCSLALQKCGLKPAVLKGTLMCNFYKGHYKSGKWGHDLQSAARKLVLSCSDDYLEELSTFNPCRDNILIFETILNYFVGDTSTILEFQT